MKTWDDLVGLMSNRTIFAYRKVYETPNDIDIWSAGISEHSLPGTKFGYHLKIKFAFFILSERTMSSLNEDSLMVMEEFAPIFFF